METKWYKCKKCRCETTTSNKKVLKDKICERCRGKVHVSKE